MIEREPLAYPQRVDFKDSSRIIRGLDSRVH